MSNAAGSLDGDREVASVDERGTTTAPTAPTAGNLVGADAGDLAERVRAAESLPLAERADAFAAVHDDLRTRLETGGAGA